MRGLFTKRTKMLVNADFLSVKTQYRKSGVNQYCLNRTKVNRKEADVGQLHRFFLNSICRFCVFTEREQQRRRYESFEEEEMLKFLFSVSFSQPNSRDRVEQKLELIRTKATKSRSDKKPKMFDQLKPILS